MTFSKFSYSLMFFSLFVLASCKSGDKKEKDAGEETTTPASSDSKPADAPTANQPKSYTATFAPDSALLGKSSEALVKVMGSSAVALSDPDGKDNGIELVIKLQATNKQSIGGGNSISVSYSDARLQLDNGTTIPAETGTDYLRAMPESSGKIESWTFQIPTGAKPTALNLFLDGTRVAMGVTLK